MASLNITYLRFFAASLGLHLVLFLIATATPQFRVRESETISVSILDAPENEQSLTRVPATPRTRSVNIPAVIAKKDSLKVRAKADSTERRKETESEIIARAERPTPLPPAATTPPPREVFPEQTVIAERELPTMKELLPPATWSSSSRNSGPVSLNTKDPVYVTYFTKIKQLIEAHWEYPEMALRYGLQGRLFLEFTIGSQGQLERLRVLRSSGSQLLDEEAVRAIRAAAPFPPIPSWVKPNPLSISAAMEYHDNRVNYQSSR